MALASDDYSNRYGIGLGEKGVSAMTEITTMRTWMAFTLLFSTAAMVVPDGPGRKPDITPA
jgi:hypothetical protein